MRKSAYITVDLEIKHKGKCPELYEKFKQFDTSVESHYQGGGVYFLNICPPKPFSNPAKCIECYCDFIGSFTGKAKTQWFAAFHTVFNIGYETSNEHWAYQSYIPASTIMQVSKLQAGVSFTLYPQEQCT